MDMLCFEFQQNRTINENLTFWGEKGGRVGWGGWKKGSPFKYFNLNYYWQTYAKVLFQMTAKSHCKWRIWRFWGRRGRIGPRGARGLLILHFYRHYYWSKYENNVFQISSKSLNKWRIWLFWGGRGGREEGGRGTRGLRGPLFINL